MNILLNIFDNPYFQNISSGIIGGLIVLAFQQFSDRRTKNRERIEHSIVGKKSLKILSQDFLYQYEPGKITIAKLMEDFGQPQRKYFDNEHNNYIFEFRNAKLEVISRPKDESVIALTIFSRLDEKYPINCRLSFEEEDQILGEAKISDSIISNSVHFESYHTNLGYETIIGCYNSYRQTKHLRYYYQISGKFDTIEQAKNEVIVQVCVTEESDIYSFFSYYDTFYN
ncbi:hypothetical protein [Sphingobacterium sp.]|uniref:hypothetical protein n=1 Tax=Sphingobacterium sp. TaxID=341027 RepID=UPI0031E292D3